jgi:hypothetical protein
MAAVHCAVEIRGGAMRELLGRLIDLGARIISWVLSVLGIMREWFLHVPLFEKIIVINTIPAFFAVTMEAGRFRIFDSWFSLTNPLAVYLIAVVVIMLAVSAFNFYDNRWFAAARVLINIYYLGWAFWYLMSDSLTKARPYEVSFWYNFNFIVPVIYIVFSALSFLSRR